MRTLSTEIQEAIANTSQTGIWAKLFEIVVDEETTLYYTDHNEVITFMEKVYTPYPIRQEEVSETSKPEMVTFTVAVSNIDKTFSVNLEQGKILGNDIKIISVFIDPGKKIQKVSCVIATVNAIVKDPLGDIV